MLLTKEKSHCEENQKIIVSKDLGTTREHRAINPGQQYCVRQYKLDGELIKQQKCCDFLLINDSLKKAYFIELKGGNIDEAIPQLENGERLCTAELQGYTFFYRIVPSKVRTHAVTSNKFKKFKDKCGTKLKYQTIKMEETLS